MQQMQRAWNYEDPENYLIDSFMSAIADGHIKQHQTTTTTTTIKPTTTSTSKYDNVKFTKHEQKSKPDLSAHLHNKLPHFLQPVRVLIDAGNGGELVTNLVLKPVAKSIAGSSGSAIANPQARAILKRGHRFEILFEPEAVAIAGPGGVAHAQSDLEIMYEDY